MSKLNQLKTLDELRLYNIPVQSVNGPLVTTREGKVLLDFVGTGYLGFDHDPRLQERGREYAARWGAICNWSRMEFDPEIYTALEDRLARFLGASSVLLSHTITITNFSVMSFLSREGIILADQVVHAVVWESCRLARDHGARLEKFKHQDMNDLEDKLKRLDKGMRKIIAVDGVYSISTEIAPIKELNELCERYNAYLYVDDAHGFGVLGRNPGEAMPLGHGGNGVMGFHGVGYENTFYVSSFGKAFGTSTAFITIPERFREENLRAHCIQYLFSAPPSPYTIGTVEASMDLNDAVGDERRFRVVSLVDRLCKGLDKLGFEVLNARRQPVVYVTIGQLEQLVDAGRRIMEAGMLPGLRAYPLVAPDKCGFRFAVTASHTEEHIDRLISFFRELRQTWSPPGR